LVRDQNQLQKMNIFDLFPPLESSEPLFLAYPGPVEPLRIDDDWVPVYTSSQIALYGLPEHWGIMCYRVVELREDASPMVTDYKMEKERGKLRPIHRYSRVERFEATLYQLLACRGKVPNRIVKLIREKGYEKDPDRIWNSIRLILKKNKGRVYYNRIPTILGMLGYEKKVQFGDSNELVRLIVNDFRILSSRFDKKKKLMGRIYFPSLRFVAFKLLEMYNVKFEYSIPFARTPRKLQAMEKIWGYLLLE